MAQELSPWSRGLWFGPFPESHFGSRSIQYWPGSFTPRAKGKHRLYECNVEHAEGNVMDLSCRAVLLDWLLTLLLKCIKGWSQLIHGSSGVPDFVCLGEIEIRGFLVVAIF